MTTMQSLIDICIENASELIQSNFGKDVIYEVSKFHIGGLSILQVLLIFVAWKSHFLISDDEYRLQLGDLMAYSTHHWMIR